MILPPPTMSKVLDDDYIEFLPHSKSQSVPIFESEYFPTFINSLCSTYLSVEYITPQLHYTMPSQVLGGQVLCWLYLLQQYD